MKCLKIKNLISLYFRPATRYNDAYESTEIDREKTMVKNITKEIKMLGQSSAVAIVLSNNHLSRMSEQIKREYPDRPVVSCKLSV